MTNTTGAAKAAACGMCELVAEGSSASVLAESELWQVRSLPGKVPIAGWILLISRRHVAGPFEFDDREAESFGPTLRYLSRLLRELTGASRIYIAALGEAAPHLHCHLVPRTDDLPFGAKGWSVFDLQRQVNDGSLAVPEAAVAAMLAELRAALERAPLP